LRFGIQNLHWVENSGYSEAKFNPVQGIWRRMVILLMIYEEIKKMLKTIHDSLYFLRILVCEGVQSCNDKNHHFQNSRLWSKKQCNMNNRILEKAFIEPRNSY
jgi:hypothetical protein